jgi:hypothetical protein
MRRRGGWLWLLVPALMLLAAGCAGTTARRGLEATRSGTPAQTVELGSLSEQLAAQYRFVESNQLVFEHLPCYCGCGQTLGHRNLRDCFVWSAGVYDAHASGCGVCQAEAIDAQTMLGKGMDVQAIRAEVRARYASMGASTKTQ